MKRSRYDLSIKVKGNHGDYIVRRRVVDHGFECTCPAWEKGRNLCHHVKEVRTAVQDITPDSALESAIERTVRLFPFLIPEENRLVRELKAVIRSFEED